MRAFVRVDTIPGRRARDYVHPQTPVQDVFGFQCDMEIINKSVSNVTNMEIEKLCS